MTTNYTPNYNLDLYASTDKPNLRDQYNAAMGKIDTQLKKSADGVTNANANVLTLQTQITEAQNDIGALESTVEAHGTQITNVQKTADDALSLAHTNESDISDTQADVTSLTSRVSTVEGTAGKNKTDIASLNTRVGVAEGNITQAQTNINSLQTAVNGKAPTNHASTANTYGQGSSTNFGHLKVADSGNAAASSGTAASPKMVKDALIGVGKDIPVSSGNAFLFRLGNMCLLQVDINPTVARETWLELFTLNEKPAKPVIGVMYTALGAGTVVIGTDGLTKVQFQDDINGNACEGQVMFYVQ